MIAVFVTTVYNDVDEFGLRHIIGGSKTIYLFLIFAFILLLILILVHTFMPTLRLKISGKAWGRI